MDSTQRNDRVNSTQRNGIQRKGTGGQCSEEWDTEEGNRVDSTQRNGYRERVN